MSNAFKADLDLLTANDDGICHTRRFAFYVHTFEGRDLDARAMATYQLSPAAGGSYHGVIDRDGGTARENDDPYIPWAAMFTGNRTGWHWCLGGRAAFTRDQWLARPKQLNKLAEVMAAYAVHEGVKLIKRSAVELVRRESGVAGHADISAAWHESDHTDPGRDFPWDVVLAKANKILAGETAPKPAPAPAAAPQDHKYPSYVDGRPLRFSEYIRHIDFKLAKLWEQKFPGRPLELAPSTFDAGSVGSKYPSYVAAGEEFTLDQYVRFIDLKVTQIFEEMKKEKK